MANFDNSTGAVASAAAPLSLQTRHRMSENAELWFVGTIAAAIAGIAFLYYWRTDALLLYGDAVAHINIARRVFDSRDPGPLQFGTVWLPLPHLLVLPFIVSNWMWRTGVGGAIPSMVAYVAGVLGVFRLVRSATAAVDANHSVVRACAWLAAIIYGANPSLVYLQATAMTEPLYLALFIWAAVYLCEFVLSYDRGIERARRKLKWCGLMLLGACMTRYDGWFAAALFGLTALIFVLVRSGISRKSFRTLWAFALLTAIGPIAWLAYNGAVYDNPLEFANGPYSAKAIAQRAVERGESTYPGFHDPKVAFTYFIKDATLNLDGGTLTPGGAHGLRRLLESLWLWLPLAATLLLIAFERRLWPLLLLWVPLPFYVLSIAWGGVPIFLPIWWPFSYYNVRYGLQMLPLAAVFVPFLIYFVARLRHSRFSVGLATTLIAVFLAYGCIAAAIARPICLREAQENNRARMSLQQRLGSELKQLPSNATILMSLVHDVGALEMAGVPLRRTLNETVEYEWDMALASPQRFSDYAVSFGQDRVAQAIAANPAWFEPLMTIETAGEQPATIWRRLPLPSGILVSPPRSADDSVWRLPTDDRRVPSIN